MEMNFIPDLKRVAFVGNYLPRQCGIATFTTDLCEAFTAEFPEMKTMALAMNDRHEGYAYPEKVRYEIRQNDLYDYERAANFLNQHEVGAICLQHEYGIYGGDAGRYILTLMRNVSAPVITTLHTVLPKPDAEQYRVLREVAELSNRVVVMSERSSDQLHQVYGIPQQKIDLIPHGIHDIPFLDPGFHKDKFGAEGRIVLLTFGLLSRNKGIEYVLDALPDVIRDYPNLLYLVLGATHPHVLLQEGEQYRESLQERVHKLGLENNVMFHNEFTSLQDLKEYIGAADIYITPYLDREQIVSGTLAYTVGAGKAVISTPYRYAEELLSEGRGLLVPFRDSKSISEKILYLLKNEAARNAMRKRAYLYGRDMIWPTVARRYMEVFEHARKQNVLDAYPIAVTGAVEEQIERVPTIKLDHFIRLTDSTGMLQHSVFSVPNYNEGYTTDDNARALIVSVQLEEVISQRGDEAERHALAQGQELGYRYLAFLWHAFNPETKYFRNFMSYDRRWLEETGSEDSHGRALWALGTVLGRSRREGLRGMAGRLFERAISTAMDFKSPRAWAFALLGTHRYLRRHPGDRAVSQVQNSLAQKLLQMYLNNHTPEWPWFENEVTYCNPALSQALIRYGHGKNDSQALAVGIESLNWLVKIQHSDQGWIMPIGSQGFYRKKSEPAYFDQQPVEVYSLVSACLEAFRVSKDWAWYDHAKEAFEWFFGRNALNLPVYDHVTGGCRDGLHIDRLNENQGAESTLSFLQAFLEMRQFEMELPSQQRERERKALSDLLADRSSKTN